MSREAEGEEGVVVLWCLRTFFADERVIPVVRIVRVTKSSMRIFEFEKLVAVLARVTRAFCAQREGRKGGRPLSSCQKRVIWQREKNIFAY